MNCGAIYLSMPCQEGGDGTRKFPCSHSIPESSATRTGSEVPLSMAASPPSYEDSRSLGGYSL